MKSGYTRSWGVFSESGLPGFTSPFFEADRHSWTSKLESPLPDFESSIPPNFSPHADVDLSSDSVQTYYPYGLNITCISPSLLYITSPIANMGLVSFISGFVAPLFIILSPLTSYADQTIAIHRTKSSAGFSLDIPLIMLVASLLRYIIHFNIDRIANS